MIRHRDEDGIGRDEKRPRFRHREAGPSFANPQVFSAEAAI
jgi:hypothetical protein